MLFKYYQKQLESKKLGIITGVIFSPFADLNNFGIGVTNFLDNNTAEPFDFALSTGNLVKDAVAGTFGTVSGVTSTLSQGILALSADEEYIKERQKDDEKYKPQNIIEGIGIGLISTIKSVGSGLTGIITNPIKGASDGGAKGFFMVIFSNL